VSSGFNQTLLQSDLETVAHALRSLNASIRDTGCLYTSEVKHTLRVVIAHIDLQLQAMPRKMPVSKVASVLRIFEKIRFWFVLHVSR